MDDSPPQSLANLVTSQEWAQIPNSIKKILVAQAQYSSQVVGANQQAETSLPQQLQHLEEKLQREQNLNELYRSVHSSLDLNTIFETVTTEAGKLLKDFDCLVVQYFPDEQLWRHINEYHTDPNAPSVLDVEISDVNNPFAAQLKLFQVVRCDNVSALNDEINQEIAVQIPGAWLLYPIKLAGNLWGSFSVISPGKPWQWREEQIELIGLIVGQLEVALHQAELYQQLEKELVERKRIEAELRESKQIFQNMASNVPGAIFRYLLRADGTDAVLYMSEGCLELWEIPAEMVLDDATLLWQMIHPDDVNDMYASVLRSAETLEPWRWSWRITTPSAQTKWLEAAGRPTKQENGDIIWDTLIVDVSTRKYAELAQRESELRYRLLAENSNDLVCLHDAAGTLVYVSPSCESLLGYQYSEMLERRFDDFVHPEDLVIWQQEMRLAIKHQNKASITYRVRCKSGHYVWFETLVKVIKESHTESLQLQSTSRDITRRVVAQRQLEHDALHDSLTGLPNRACLMNRLEFALKKTKRHPEYQFALLFLDVDRFKIINDSLGHFVGDQLLIGVAQKLKSILRETDLAARLGGDEFVIFLEEIDDLQTPLRIVDRIFQVLQAPFEIGDRPVYVSASIGIVIGNSGYQDESAVLRDADIAMYRAKNQGKSRYEIFDQEMHQQIMQQLHLESDLRQAIAREEFLFYYQPIVDLQTGKLAGFEALIRWQHPEKGLQAPGIFLDLIEETGLITQIDQWGITKICQQLQQWRSQYPQAQNLYVSLNLSAKDLAQENFLTNLIQTIEANELPTTAIVLEITESILIDDIRTTISLLKQLRNLGFKISIDDFGTGYSSMSYLHQLPIDNLKVDKSFVMAVLADIKNQRIVETIFTLSQCLELQAIAEGIETLEQLNFLKALGYQYGQGYFFAKPLSPEDAVTLFIEPNPSLFS